LRDFPPDSDMTVPHGGCRYGRILALCHGLPIAIDNTDMLLFCYYSPLVCFLVPTVLWPLFMVSLLLVFSHFSCTFN
jgi:hypothetical protein